MDDGEHDKLKDASILNGSSAQPRDASISSTASGIPNDSSEPLEIDEKEVAEIENKLRRE